MSLLFLSNLLDLSPNDIGHKKDLIVKYASSSDKKAIQNLLDYFTNAARDYKMFNLSTFYSVKNLEIDLENLTVIAHGILTSYYGKGGHDSQNEDYKLVFEYQGGNLRLKSFVRLIDAEKEARDIAKNEKFEKEVQQTLDPQGKDLKESADKTNQKTKSRFKRNDVDENDRESIDKEEDEILEGNTGNNNDVNKERGL
jgi:hypothetical protein